MHTAMLASGCSKSC